MTELLLNGPKLYAIAHASPTAEIVTTYLACRERNRKFVDISRTETHLLREGEKIVGDDYLRYWRSLESAGMGKILYAKRGRMTKFLLNQSLKKMAEVALDGKDAKADKIEAPAPEASVIPSGLLCVVLRPNFSVQLKLPHDISAKEIDLIGNALKSFSS